MLINFLIWLNIVLPIILIIYSLWLLRHCGIPWTTPFLFFLIGHSTIMLVRRFLVLASGIVMTTKVVILYLVLPITATLSLLGAIVCLHNVAKKILKNGNKLSAVRDVNRAIFCKQQEEFHRAMLRLEKTLK